MRPTFSPIAASTGSSRPKANSAFVAVMEDVLAVYTRPRDGDCPLVCLDETSKQLIAETRVPISRPTSQCLDRRIPNKQILIDEIAAREHDRNANHTKADWQFTTKNARIKLKLCNLTESGD